MELYRAPGASQRSSDIAQSQLAGEVSAILARKRADAAEQMRRDKVRHERDRRRRESERHAEDHSDDAEPEEGGSVLDVVV